MTALRSISHSFVQVLTKLPWRDVPGDLWRAGRGILRALWSSRRKECRDLGKLRDAHCEQCPMYCAWWKTCGEPGDIDEETGMKIGCWCHTPLANVDPKKDCWARANGLEHVGWPDALRPSESLVAEAVESHHPASGYEPE